MAEKRYRSFKIQSTIDLYTYHVLDKLIGIKGTSVSDVANFILKDWIDDHKEEIEKYGISVKVKAGKLLIGQ